MTLAESMLPEFDNEMASTRKMLSAVPDGKMDYKPHEKSMTLGRLAGHIAEMPNWAKHAFAAEEYVLQPGQQGYAASNQAELVGTFERNMKEARELLVKVSDEEFRKTWSLKMGDKTIFALPRTAVYRATVMNHMIHHRAQLSVYLRLLDVEVPGMYGPSADEMKFWTPPA